MAKLQTRSRVVRSAIVVPVMVLALAACGGSEDAATTAAASATATGGPGGGGGGGMDFTAMQACLTAAGIEVTLPTGMASGGSRPSGTFNGTPSAGDSTPGARPSGTAGGGGGDGGGMSEIFESDEAQAALKACGITVPTGGSQPSTSATASS